MKRLGLVGLALLLFASALWALPARGGLTIDQDVQAEENFVGAALNTAVDYTVPLVLGEGPLLEPAFVRFSFKNAVSPSYEQFGLGVDIAPIAIFDLYLYAGGIDFYKALGFGFLPMSSYGDAATTEALAALTQGEATGVTLQVKPTFKIQLGPVIALDSVAFSWFIVDGSSGYYWDRSNHVILADGDVEIFNTAYLLYDLGKGFMAGLTDSNVFVPASSYEQNVLYSIALWKGPVAPTLDLSAALQVGWWLQDRYLDGLRIAGQVGIVWRP